jgi:hypothetical protein
MAILQADSLRAGVRAALAEIDRLRHEIEVDLHLASAHARESWALLELRVRTLERALHESHERPHPSGPALEGGEHPRFAELRELLAELQALRAATKRSRTTTVPPPPKRP